MPSRLGLLAGFLVLGAVTFWFLRLDGRNTMRAGTASEPTLERGRERGSLETAPALESAQASSRASSPMPLPSARESVAERVPSGILRGQLVEAESGAPFEAERIVVLATAGNRVAETLRSSADGGFTSTRAFPRGLVRAWVRDTESGAVLVKHEAEFDPVAAGTWCVPVPEPLPEPLQRAPQEFEGTSVRGRVVSSSGRSLEGVFVKALPRVEGRALVTANTDAGGAFWLDLEPGAYRLLALGAFATSAPLDLEVVVGLNEVGRLVLPVEDSPGPLRGRLVAVAGTPDPFAVVLVRDLASGRDLVVTPHWGWFGPGDDCSFEIRGLPAGEYELSLVPIDGRRYEPERLRASPPEDGLEFRTFEAIGRGYVLDVRDERSGEALDPSTALARIRGQWLGEDGAEHGFPLGFDRWVAYAKNHRPSSGDFAHAVPFVDEEGNELGRIEVELLPGFGLAVLFKDAESVRLVAPAFDGAFGEGVAGAEVLADGKVVATSDGDGLALVDLLRAPERLEFRKAGWRVAGERRESGVRWVHLMRE